MEPDLKKPLNILIKLSIVLLSLFIFFALVKWIFPILGKIAITLPLVLAPFIVAFLLSLIIDPLVTWLQQHGRMNRSWSVLVALLIVIGGIGGILIAVITRVARELAGLYELVNANSADIVFSITKLLNDLQLAYLRLNLPENLQKSLIDSLGVVAAKIEHLLSGAASGLVSILLNLPQMFIFILIIAIATFFIARDWPTMRYKVLAIIPRNQKAKASFLFNDLIHTFVGFLKAETTLVSITALWFIVGLKVLGVDYALTIGILAGLFDILPVLGPGTLMVPWIIWSFIVGNIKLGIGVLVIYILASVVRQILEPRILGNNIGLHPLVTLLSLYVGLQLGGVAGMILAPVLVVFIMSLIKAGVFDDIKWFRKHSS
ncbi:MAG: sporulation integral membrane protein YtvI [Methylocystaceae bacterium]